jgi:hypothetical protein
MTRRPALWVLPVALAGVAAGHSLSYLLAVPNPGQRAALLMRTGHSYWHVAVLVAVVLELGGAFALAARHVRAGRIGIPAPPLAFPNLAGRLVALQAGAFTVLEVAERLRSGIPVGEMLQNHLFPLGLGVQVLVGCAVAFLLGWLARAAAAIGLSPRRAPLPRTAGARPLRRRLDLPACSPLCEASRGRAPPPPLVSSH